jgi:hypothetical protein
MAAISTKSANEDMPNGSLSSSRMVNDKDRWPYWTSLLPLLIAAPSHITNTNSNNDNASKSTTAGRNTRSSLIEWHNRFVTAANVAIRRWRTVSHSHNQSITCMQC